MENKYLYTTMTGSAEVDDAFFKKLDETGITWRSGQKPSAYDGWKYLGDDAKNIILGYKDQSISSDLIGVPGETKQVSPEEFIEAARKMAQEAK